MESVGRHKEAVTEVYSVPTVLGNERSTAHSGAGPGGGELTWLRAFLPRGTEPRLQSRYACVSRTDPA